MSGLKKAVGTVFDIQEPFLGSKLLSQQLFLLTNENTALLIPALLCLFYNSLVVLVQV